jgi:hypothetical protein
MTTTTLDRVDFAIGSNIIDGVKTPKVLLRDGQVLVLCFEEWEIDLNDFLAVCEDCEVDLIEVFNPPTVRLTMREVVHGVRNNC